MLLLWVLLLFHRSWCWKPQMLQRFPDPISTGFDNSFDLWLRDLWLGLLATYASVYSLDAESHGYVCFLGCVHMDCCLKQSSFQFWVNACLRLRGRIPAVGWCGSPAAIPRCVVLRRGWPAGSMGTFYIAAFPWWRAWRWASGLQTKPSEVWMLPYSATSVLYAYVGNSVVDVKYRICKQGFHFYVSTSGAE